MTQPTLNDSDFITLPEACLLIPPRRGKKVHVSTLLRWGKAGRITLYRDSRYKVSRSEVLHMFRLRQIKPP